MVQDYTEKIESLIIKNNNLISSMGEIYRTIDTEIANNVPESIDMDMIYSLQSDSKSMKKKIQDNLISIDDFLARNILASDYYEKQANDFLKKAVHVSNFIPSDIVSGTTLTTNVIFKNMGLFYSWTTDKLISLEVLLMDSDNNQISIDDFIFDPNLSGNAPGEETTNGDYLLNKRFDIVLNILPVPPGEYTFVLTVKDPVYRFYDSFKVIVNMS